MKVRNCFNAGVDPGYVFTLPSITVPDQAMSIAEILRRFTNGQTLGGAKQVYYDEDEDFPDIKTMDLTEIQAMSDEYDLKRKNYDNEKAKVAAQKLADKQKADFDAAVQAHLQAIQGKVPSA